MFQTREVLLQQSISTLWTKLDSRNSCQKNCCRKLNCTTFLKVWPSCILLGILKEKQDATYDEGSKGSIHLRGAGRGEEGVVHVVSNIGREAPVVGAVLEEIEDGHGAVTEPVHEESFQHPLGVVHTVARSGNAGKEQVVKGLTRSWLPILQWWIIKKIHPQHQWKLFN